MDLARCWRSVQRNQRRWKKLGVDTDWLTPPNDRCGKKWKRLMRKFAIKVQRYCKTPVSLSSLREAGGVAANPSPGNLLTALDNVSSLKTPAQVSVDGLKTYLSKHKATGALAFLKDTDNLRLIGPKQNPIDEFISTTLPYMSIGEWLCVSSVSCTDSS